MDDLFGKPPSEDDYNSPTQTGNKFWRRGPFLGRPRKFATPEDLAEACLNYFDWVEDNPLLEDKVFGTGFTAKLNKCRAMSIGALCIYLGISKRSWHVYLDRKEFKEVCEHAQSVMDTYNLEAAVAGLANANIIARQLGLMEKILHGSDPDNPMPNATDKMDLSKLTEQELADLERLTDKTRDSGGTGQED